MPTARSWTDRLPGRFTDPVRDVGHLLAFRSAAVRRRGTLQRAAGVVLGLTLLAIEACSSVLVLRGGARVATVTAHEMAGEEGARAYRGLLD